MKCLVAALALFAGMVSALHASEPAVPPVHIDGQGVIRWNRGDGEVRLFGANYCAFSGGDYRMAGLVGADRKAMIDEDMAHFARLGWTGLRLCSWGDWENADAEGNLVENDHSDLMDYLIARAKERGISILLTPIHTYDPRYADKMGAEKDPGFSGLYPRSALGTDPKAIAAEQNYIRQLLRHVNPYTGLALKDDPAILFVEMINEPVHHPEDLPGSVAYIDGLVDAVRSSGSKQITVFNYSQDFRIGPAIGQSKVQAVDFGWYPSGLVAGHEQRGNFLPAVDHYPAMLSPDIAKLPRIVYEFDPADLDTGYMLPAMARTFRSVGAQFATIFAYDMLETAPFNLGWQTHFINLVHTPRQAISAAIAAEAMRRLPRTDYGDYPANRRFGDFSVDYETDSSLLAAPDAYMNAGDSEVLPPDAKKLTRIAGVGSSPLVRYPGTGAYFLDKVRDGVWRLEVYPDQLKVADPFAQPQPGKVVSRLYARSWPTHITLPDLGEAFHVTPVSSSGAVRQAENGVVDLTPGVWLLSRAASVDPAGLPATIGAVRFGEYHVNAPRTYPDLIQSKGAEEFVAGAAVEIRVQVASAEPPESVTLHLRPSATGHFSRSLPMKPVGAYLYAATIPAGELPPGLYDYVVSETVGGVSTTFPGAVTGQPGQWPFAAGETWSFRIVPIGTALDLFDAGRDTAQLAFSRPDEDHHGPYFRLVPGESDGQAALSFGLPDLGGTSPEVYGAALYMGDRVTARGEDIAGARSLAVRLRATADDTDQIDVTLIEKDGSGWRGTVSAGREWQTVRLPLSSLVFSKSLLIPTPYPGVWDYWRNGPAARAQGPLRIGDVERLELRSQGGKVEIESVRLDYRD
jgi:hypothetical protein